MGEKRLLYCTVLVEASSTEIGNDFSEKNVFLVLELPNCF